MAILVFATFPESEKDWALVSGLTKSKGHAKNKIRLISFIISKKSLVNSVAYPG